MSLLDGFQLKRANVAEVIKNSQLSRARNLYEFDKLVENLDRTLTRQSRSAKQYVKTKEMMDIYHNERAQRLEMDDKKISDNISDMLEQANDMGIEL